LLQIIPKIKNRKSPYSLHHENPAFIYFGNQAILKTGTRGIPPSDYSDLAFVGKYLSAKVAMFELK